MKAIQINCVTEPEELEISHVPTPTPRDGWVLIHVEAAGLNHAELVLMEGEINATYIKKPIIPGIECVGTVVDGGGTEFRRGDYVLALMGGMGRSFDGSWAEYTLVPSDHVFHISIDWPPYRIAAAGEAYFTAWGSLMTGLRVLPEDSLLIRGVSSAVGCAALQLAKEMGLRVSVTVRRTERIQQMRALGADEIILNDCEDFASRGQCWDKALELVGVKTLLDTLKVLRPDGICCCTGILGGESSINGFDPIRDIPNGVYLTGFYSNSPTQAEIDRMFTFLKEHNLEPPVTVYPFRDISYAWQTKISGKDNGRIVLAMDEHNQPSSRH